MKNKIIFVLLISIILAACGQTEEPQIHTGTIQDKYFKSGGTSTGVGISSSGEAVVTTQSTSDEYIIFIDGENYNVKKEIWFDLEKGMNVKYTKGFFGIKIVEIP